MTSLDDAIKILKSGRLREGMEVLENLVANHPENVDVLYNLGMCYSELRNIDKSTGTLEKCVSLAPQHANALTALGYSYSYGAVPDAGALHTAPWRFRVAFPSSSVMCVHSRTGPSCLCTDDAGLCLGLLETRPWCRAIAPDSSINPQLKPVFPNKLL